MFLFSKALVGPHPSKTQQNRNRFFGFPSPASLPEALLTRCEASWEGKIRTYAVQVSTSNLTYVMLLVVVGTSLLVTQAPWF